MNDMSKMWYDGKSTLLAAGDGVAKLLRGKLSKSEMDENAARLVAGWNRSPELLSLAEGLASLRNRSGRIDLTDSSKREAVYALVQSADSILAKYNRE